MSHDEELGEKFKITSLILISWFKFLEVCVEVNYLLQLIFVFPLFLTDIKNNIYTNHTFSGYHWKWCKVLIASSVTSAWRVDPKAVSWRPYPFSRQTSKFHHTTNPRLWTKYFTLCSWVFFLTLLPSRFNNAKLLNLTISKRGLKVRILLVWKTREQLL